MTEPYQPKYQWKRTQIDEHDPPTDLDWCGFDGVLPIGRIMKETSGPTMGQWHWAGWFPKTYKGRPPSPNAGYEATARLATQKVEEYWARCMQVMEPRYREKPHGICRS